VPLLAILREYLTDHLITTRRSGSDLVFGRTPADPFVPSTLSAIADRAWRKAGLTFDECGHLFPGSREETRAQMDAYLETVLSHGTTAGQ
jgi:hypothetical protein